MHVAPLLKRLLFALLLPVALALALDLLLETLPWLTLATSLVCIPLASLLVGRAALRDFERIVAIVAPAEPHAEPHAGPADDAASAGDLAAEESAQTAESAPRPTAVSLPPLKVTRHEQGLAL